MSVGTDQWYREARSLDTFSEHGKTNGPKQPVQSIGSNAKSKRCSSPREQMVDALRLMDRALEDKSTSVLSEANRQTPSRPAAAAVAAGGSTASSHSRKQSLDEVVKTYSDESIQMHPPGKLSRFHTDFISYDERTELERDFSLNKRREDLELADLIPLPDFSRFPSKIPPEDLGSAIQLLEFYHIFAHHLNLSIPRGDGPADQTSLSWSVLECCLTDCDPCGPLAELFTSLLCVLRKLDVKANNKQVSTPVAICTHTDRDASESAQMRTMFCPNADEEVTSSSMEPIIPGDDMLSRVFRATGVATRFSEICGIPVVGQVISKSAVLPHQMEATQPEPIDVCSEDVSTNDAEDGRPAGGLANASRAPFTQVLVPVCPLDRAGLSKAVWLHIASATMRFAGWRSNTFGGVRALDDPAVVLARDYPDLMAKLECVSVYELSIHEKLVLLTCLIDQLLLYPKMRERYEESFDRLRVLQTPIRATPPLPPAITSVPNQTTTTTTTANGDSETATMPPPPPPALSVNKKEECEAESMSSITPAPSRVSVDVGSTNQGTEDDGEPKSATVAMPDSTKDANVITDEQHTFNATFKCSRTCSMMPLGQDRFYRRYWLLLSMSCILIEDTPFRVSPTSPEVVLLCRQFASVYPEVAEHMGLTTTEAAAKRLRQSRGSSLRYADHCLSVTKPIKSIDIKQMSLEELRALVRPERVPPGEVSRLRWVLYDEHDGDKRPEWYLLKPVAGPVPRSVSTEKSNEFTTKPIQTKVDNCAHTDIPNGTEFDCASVETASMTSQDIMTTDVMERAKWTLDCLEASLNPRGFREARLRKTLGQLRPFLLPLIAAADDSSVDTKIEEHSPENETSKNTVDDSTLSSASTALVRNSPQQSFKISLLSIWLEIALRRLAARLRLSSQIRPLLAQASKPCSPNPIKSEDDQCALNSLTLPTTECPDRLKLLTEVLFVLGQSVCSFEKSNPGEETATEKETVGDNKSTVLDTSVSETDTDAESRFRPKVTNGGRPPFRPSGWPRWCSLLESATSTSELHLLARTLDRGVRFATQANRNCPLTGASRRFRLPGMRCTACNTPPDVSNPNPCDAVGSPQPSNATGTPKNNLHPRRPPSQANIALSVCSGCSSPFHADCLIDSRSRTRRTSCTVIQTDNVDRTRMGYCGLLSSFTSTTTARMETTGASLVLCNACLRVAGRRGPSTRAAASESGVPISNPISIEAMDPLTGDEDWTLSSYDEELADFRHRHPRPFSWSSFGCPLDTQPDPVSTSSTTEPEELPPRQRHSIFNRKDPSFPFVEAGEEGEEGTEDDPTFIVAVNQRPRIPSAKARMSGPRSRLSQAKRIRLSLSPKTPKQSNKRRRISEVDGADKPVKKDGVKNKKYKAAAAVAPPPPDHPMTFSKVILNGQSSDWDEDDVIKFRNFGCLKRAKVILSPCDLLMNDNRYIIPPKLTVTDRPARAQKNSSVSNPCLIKSNSPLSSKAPPPSAQPPNPLTQHSVERLFIDLCNCSAARPLLRCGLGRSIANGDVMDPELRRVGSGGGGAQSRQRSRRTSKPSRDLDAPAESAKKLYAWDLNGLQDLLVRQDLPGGPKQAIEQLRLLLTHWQRINRPGSRLHQCALEVSQQLTTRLDRLITPPSTEMVD